jgi:hypothetical protein
MFVNVRLPDVVAVADIVFTLNKSFPPKPKSPVICLPPSTNKYCWWSSAVSPNKLPCIEVAFTPLALKPITGLISSI